MSDSTGWLTLHEVLEVTGLPYGELMTLVEQGAIGSRASGAAVLYDADDVQLVVAAEKH